MTATAQPIVTAERESALLASVPTGLLIDGQWRPAASGKTFDVEDPSTGKVLLSLADAGPRGRGGGPGRGGRRAGVLGEGPARVSAGRSCAGPSSW